MGVIRFQASDKNLKEAVKKRAALACFLLGFLYESGRGVVQDYKKAKECYQKAIKTGNEEVKNLA
ncbi:hypothetical protein NHP194003_13900 [Helicobacter suis]|uniref:beta-lactamase n=1 Tax=Helicobacter suis TaxID=104628 RepID=A0A6J4CWN6_9HELI|nr:hypothetical protein NHP190020_09270 [Helicobacter suis]BDR28425.1 hypothetical protein HSHS1_11860 [Helicobacter suis HS1]BCD48186.1 hypothetical protein NHP194003_13900 [Helicobacter suis]BCD51708.1 hypothetical protein NHP194022_13790 [Helicobacter suis]BCD69908.1 hypothetical protein SNTW_05530 [Helicobacter suis]